MPIKQHFTLLVYPFRHGVSHGRHGPPLRRHRGRWRPWIDRLDDVGLVRAVADSYFLLPQFRKLMFPDLAPPLSGDPAHQVAEIRDRARASSLRRPPQGSVLRLTCSPEVLGTLHPRQLLGTRTDPKGAPTDPFRICLDWIDVALFPQRVGFLVLKVRLDEHEPPVSRYIDFLRSAQLLQPLTIGPGAMPSWICSPPSGEYRCTSRDIVDFLLQGLVDDVAAYDADVPAFLARHTGEAAARRYSVREAAQVYGRTFRLFSYVCLDGPPENPAFPPSAPVAATPPPFESPTQRTLYELATCTHTADPDYAPHPAGVTQLMAAGRVALWENWEGMVLHDNVVFLGLRPSAFLLSALARNVETDYFHLYLLALYQKIRLSLLTGELTRGAAALYRNLWETRALAEAFARFRNHYWAAEVSFRPQGMELYRRFQRALGVNALYDSVREEAQGLRDYYERLSARRIGIFLGLIALINGVEFLLNHFHALVTFVQTHAGGPLLFNLIRQSLRLP